MGGNCRGSSLLYVGNPEIELSRNEMDYCARFLLDLYPRAFALAAWIMLLMPSRTPLVIRDSNQRSTPSQ